MKSVKVMLMTAVAVMGLALTGCSKDYAKDVAGTYQGTATMSMTMSGTTREIGSVDGKLVITAEDEEHVTVTVPAISGGTGMEIPDFNITGVEVDKKGNLSKKDFSVSVSQWTISGDFTGKVDDGKLNAQYSINIPGMPHTLDVTFVSK